MRAFTSPLFVVAALGGPGGLGWLGLACSNLPLEEPPAPHVERAPQAMSHLAVHVFQLVQPPATPEDEWDYHHTPGYTATLRRAFQSQLQQAGYTVLLERTTPADLVATIQSDMPPDKPGVATLVLSREGAIVDRLSVPVRVSGDPPRTVHHVDEAAVRLVEAMSRSTRVAEQAREALARRSEGAPRREPTMAAAGCPPPRGAVQEEPVAPEVECRVERRIRCQAPSPVLSAWQPSPFSECPREIPSFERNLLGQPGRFSPAATREARLAGACGETPESGVCCFVQFVAQACD